MKGNRLTNSTCMHDSCLLACRLFLSPYDLTPTYKDVHNKFSVRYFLNLVLVDEEDRRYFKQQEITLYRKDENAPQQPPQQPSQQQPAPAPVQQQQLQPEVQGAPAAAPAPVPVSAPVEQPPVQAAPAAAAAEPLAPAPAPVQAHQSHEPLMFADEPPLQQEAAATAAAADGS